jgi:hypothetical protein
VKVVLALALVALLVVLVATRRHRAASSPRAAPAVARVAAVPVVRFALPRSRAPAPAEPDLPCDEPLSGTVREEAGAPIEGAIVAPESDEWAELAVVTDAHGRFRSCPYDGGMRALADGYAPEKVRWGLLSDVEVVLRPVTMVDGTVLDTDGVPIAGSTVLVDYGRSQRVTNAAGRVRIDDIPPGLHSLRCVARGYLAFGELAVESVPGRPAAGECLLQKGIEVTGRVLIGGAPYAGVQVNADIENHTQITDSAADGSFAILLPPGGRVRFRVVGFELVSAPVLDLDRDRSDVILAMAGGGFLEGRVTWHGAGIPATVTIGCNDTSREIATDATGSYRSPLLPAGSCAVLVRARAKGARPSSGRFNVVADRTQRGADLELEDERDASTLARSIDSARDP